MNLKILRKNTAFYSFTIFLQRGSSFLLIPVYTHFLTLAEYGLLAAILLSIRVLAIFFDLGSRRAVTRYTESYYNENKAGLIVGSSVFINIVSGAFLSFLIILFLQPVFQEVFHLENIKNYILLICLTSFTQSLNLNLQTYFRARNRSALFAKLNLLQSILQMGLTIVFLAFINRSVEGILMAQTITFSTMIFINLIIIVKEIKLAISFSTIRMTLQYGTPLVFETASNFTETAAVYFLSYFASLEAVALYSLALKIASITSMIVILPFQLAYEPFVFANLNSENIKKTIARLATYMLLAICFVGIGIVFVFRDLISLIATPEYFSAYYLIFLIIPAFSFIGLKTIAQSLLNIQNKTYITGAIVISHSLIGIGLHYFFVLHFGLYGIIFVFNFISFLITFSLMYFGLKEYPISLEVKRIAVTAVVFISMLGAIYFLSAFSTFLYYITIPLLILTVFIILYYGNFFTVQEKGYIKTVFRKKSLHLNV